MAIQYAYDTANRQVGIVSTKTDGITEKLCQTNRYDWEGLRYETEENGKVIRFLFDRGELAQGNDGETSYIRGYRHSPVLLNRNGKDNSYFVQDEMGSTLLLLDESHEIRKTYRYDAFGNILKETGDILNRLTYTAQIYDGTAVQYYLRARFYNPAIGRFMQEDTYRGDGLNLYAYCANNPVIYYDPSGNSLCPNGKTAPANDGSSEGGTGIIHNDVLDSPRTGSALTVDEISPIYEIDPRTGRTCINQEFPARPQAHGFTDIVDNYAGYAIKTPIDNGVLYQIEGSLNSVPGRFEWIIQDSQVTHRMFIQNGTMNGVPIKP